MSSCEAQLRIHGFIPKSLVNGPGERAVIWLQGCTLGCPGCFNPSTHDPLAGNLVTIEKLFEQLYALQDRIEGITISGGEPLQQMDPITALLKRVREETSLSTLLFTGFRWSEIQQMPGAGRLLETLDVVLAGRYEQNNRIASGLLGSSNKTIHFLTPRYSERDLGRIPEAEVIVTHTGEMIFSGIDPLIFRPMAGRND